MKKLNTLNISAQKIRWSLASGIVRLGALIPSQLRKAISRSSIAKMPRELIAILVRDCGPAQYVIKAGPAKGLLIVTDMKSYRGYLLGTYEPGIAEKLASLLEEGMVAIDAGAHHGYFTLLMSKLVGEGGTVFSFEPSPDNYTLINQTVSVNNMHNVVLEPVAISKRSGLFSFRLGLPYGSVNRIIGSEEEWQTGCIEISAISLDEFFKHKEIKRIDLIKIDVEGHEMNVLEGAQEIIMMFHPIIICEFHNDESFSLGETILKKHNYSIDVLRERMPIQVIAI